MSNTKEFKENQHVKYNNKAWIVIGTSNIDGFTKYRLKRGNYRAMAFADEIEPIEKEKQSWI